MRDALHEWVVSAYDEYVAAESAAGAVDFGKGKEEVARLYERGVESGELRPEQIDHFTEGLRLVDRVIVPVRKSRRNGMRATAMHLLAVLRGETLLEDQDPLLEAAFPLGDGSDKTLRHWTSEDWTKATIERYRNAADVTQAAADFDSLTRQILEAMRVRRVTTVDDLLAWQAEDEQ